MAQYLCEAPHAVVREYCKNACSDIGTALPETAQEHATTDQGWFQTSTRHRYAPIFHITIVPTIPNTKTLLTIRSSFPKRAYWVLVPLTLAFSFGLTLTLWLTPTILFLLDTWGWVPGLALMLLVGAIALEVLLLVIRYISLCHKHVHDTSREILLLLEKNIRITQLAPNSLTDVYGPGPAYIILASSLPLPFAVHHMFGVLLSIFAGTIVSIYVLRVVIALRMIDTWRNVLVNILSCSVHIVLWPLLCCQIILLGTIAPIVAKDRRESDLPLSVQYENATDYFFSIVHDYPTEDIPPLRGRQGGQTSTSADLLALVFIFHSLIGFRWNLMQMSILFNNWKTAQSRSSSISGAWLPSSDTIKFTTLDRGLLLAFGIATGLMHWACVFVTVEVLSFHLFGVSLLPISMYLQALCHYGCRSFFGPFVGPFFASLSFAMLAAPGLIVVIMTCKCLLRMVASQCNLYGRIQKPVALKLSFLHTACNTHNVPFPSVRVENSAHTVLYSTQKLLTRNWQIVVSDNIVQHLTQREVQALFLHELSHRKYDLQWINVLKVLSIVLLHPSYYFLLLLDYADRETCADEFAARNIHDSQVLMFALTKLAIIGFTNDDLSIGSQLRSKKMKSVAEDEVRASLHLLLGSSIFGAAYPPLRNRMQRIQEEMIRNGKEI